MYLMVLLAFLITASWSLKAGTVEEIGVAYGALHTHVRTALGGSYTEFFETRASIINELKKLGKEKEHKDVIDSLLPPPMLVLPATELSGSAFRAEAVTDLGDGHEALMPLKERMDKLSALSS